MVQLQFTHLLYDIEQQTHALAEARVQNNPELKAEEQIDSTNHLRDIAMRYCEEGVALLKVLLKDKLVQDDSPVEQPQTDVLSYDSKSWDFDITLPNIDEHTLATLFHRFVVFYTLFQWAKLFSPSEAKQFKDMLDQAEKEIKKALYALGTPSKRWHQHDCCIAYPEGTMPPFTPPLPEITFEP